jgi:acylphosphatase
MGKKIAKRWIITGDVQGVGFRLFVQNKANGLGLGGWARNRSDGSVEVYAAGPVEKLSTLAAALHAGPRLAYVRGVEELDEAVEALSKFTIR